MTNLLIEIKDLELYDIDLNDNRYFLFNELEQEMHSRFDKVMLMVQNYFKEELGSREVSFIKLELSDFFDGLIKRKILLKKGLEENLFLYEKRLEDIYILNYNRIKVVLSCYEDLEKYTYNQFERAIQKISLKTSKSDAIIKMKNGKPYPASAIARYFHLANIFIPSVVDSKEYIIPYGLKSIDSFYNQYFTKLNSLSKRIAVNGESKKAYVAIIQIYNKTIELCEFHDDMNTKERAIKELEIAKRNKETMFPE